MTEPLAYRLRFLEPQTHFVDVELTVADPGAAGFELWMPVWTPGSYLVREYSRHVEELHAEDANGAPLSVTKVRKNRWRVAGSAGAVTVHYRVYGREKSVRTNWVDGDYALLNGAATFLTVAGRERAPHRVRVDLPAGWTRVVTGLPGDAGSGFTAADLDTLVDSPLLCGNPACYEFKVAGKPIVLANQGEGGLWDGAAAARDVAAVVNAYAEFYGGLPFDRYAFLNLLVEGRGGLEHKNSCVLMASRYAYRDRDGYLDWLGLVSHEFFHVWNVKRSRPRELGPFDYETENYTRGLWVVEGITSYYTDLVPARLGLSTQIEYLQILGGKIDQLMNVPGRSLQSLEDAGFDAWIKLYRRDEHTNNSTVSYYLKGGLVAWLLDVEIRRLTGDRRSLDDLMRLLYARYSGEHGFRDEDVQAAAEEAADAPLGDFFDHAIRSAAELDWQPALDHLGLQFPPDTARPRSWLGVETTVNDGRLVVTSVRRDGPAWEAGLTVEDEILAVGGYRVAKPNLAARLQQYAPGTRVEVLVSRFDAVRVIPVVLGQAPLERWKLQVDPDASPEAVAARRAWLGARIPEA